jgi:hypothetical protein
MRVEKDDKKGDSNLHSELGKKKLQSYSALIQQVNIRRNVEEEKQIRSKQESSTPSLDSNDVADEALS